MEGRIIVRQRVFHAKCSHKIFGGGSPKHYLYGIAQQEGTTVIYFSTGFVIDSPAAMPLVLLIVIIMVFVIPILGILLAGYKEWLKFKAKHRELGTSTREVEDHLQSLRERLDRVEQERDALRERVQNLETIVTSEAWIAQHEDSTEVSPLNATEMGDLELPSDRKTESQSDAEHTAEIARRLRNQ